MNSSYFEVKKGSAQKALSQARKYYSERDPDIPLTKNFQIQDSILVNLQRVCEACIDIAQHLCRDQKLGTPSTSSKAFLKLKEAGIIDDAIYQNMKTMVGFRNIAVHQYQDLNLDIVIEILENSGSQLIDFVDMVGTYLDSKG